LKRREKKREKIKKKNQVRVELSVGWRREKKTPIVKMLM
jgi:hypothetical protein